MSRYQLSLRQKILTKKDIPPTDVMIRLPRSGPGRGQDYRVVTQYDLVWWPEANPAHLEKVGCFLTQFEARGSA